MEYKNNNLSFWSLLCDTADIRNIKTINVFDKHTGREESVVSDTCTSVEPIFLLNSISRNVPSLLSPKFPSMLGGF